MTQVGDLDYLNELYAAAEDPWHLRSGWYYQRKRDLLLATLPRARYSRAAQLGCDDPELVVGLSRRSDAVSAFDFDRPSVTAMRQHVAHLSHVEVGQPLRPDRWHAAQPSFDLVVLNEVGSRSDAATWAQLCHSVSEHLAPDATVLACHYRHSLKGRVLHAETVHGMLESILGLTKQAHVADADLIIDVWTTSARTVAEMDGITARLGGQA
jgi:hypothetical protein